MLRECAAVRTSVGMMDATTLGKIEVWGTDAGEFLNRIYTNAFKKLKAGMGRYGHWRAAYLKRCLKKGSGVPAQIRDAG